MSNARELALLEKWTSSSDGATILPGLSSPTSPKATKFCCCPNRRRYTLKQPKLTTTLHVRNIFVDNDFNFIDDTTTENDDDEEDGENAENGQGDNNIEEILLYDKKNYKRAVSWPSARRTLKNSNRNHNNNQNNNNNNNSKLTKPIEVSVEAPKENRSRIQVTATATATKSAASSANDYDDIVEVAAKNSAGGISASESTEKFKIAEAETNEWRRHDKSCHNNRNNCLTKNDEQQNERKSNNDYDDDRCSLEEESLRVQQEQQGNEQQQHLGHDQQSQPTKCGLRKSLKPLPIGNDEGRDVTSSTSSTSQSNCFNYSSTKNGEQCLGISRLLASPKNLKANEQNAAIATTKTSPIIQRLSEIREIKDSLCKQTLSNTTATQQQQQHPEHCNNCQFCFNQSCRNFSQLQQSLQDIDNNSNTSKNRQPFSPIGNNQKMTITTNTSTNVANSFQEPGVVAVASPKQPTDIGSGLSLTAAMNNDMSSLPPATARTQVPPSTLMLATSNNRPTSPNNTQLLSLTPASSHQQCNTPSSPLTTTVIKTTMVKRSPANESTTSPTAASASAATSPTSASLTLEKSLAFITTTTPFCNNVPHYPQQDASSMATKENKPANTSNKCLSDAKGTLLPKVAMSSSTTPMSVKERIAALVAGNEQNQKQHDNNFINNRTSMKNQCNKTMRSTSLQQQSNMTYPQRHGQAATSVFNSSSNMCQQSLSPTTLRARKASLVADEVDSGPVDGNETNLLLTSKATNAGNEGEVVEDINDNLNRTNTTTTTTPTSSLSQTASSGMGRLSAKPSPSDDTHKPSHGSVTNNHMAYHNAAVNKYGSSGGAAATATATATATSPSTSSSNSAMTVDSRTQQRSILSNTNRNQSLPTSSGSAATSSSNDTNGDNRLYDLTVAATPTTSPISNTSPQGDGDGNETEAATTSSSSRNKLEALANLDLALNLYNLPLDVDDDDDPYFVLQEYLERVKHEINEVFELHKARQKAQQQQQQQHQEQQAVPPFESDTNTAGTSIENQIIDTLKAAVSNDELSRSTESDSGFDSATGGGRRGAGAGAASASTPQLDVGSNKLPSRAKVTTTSTDAKENDNKKASRPQEDNSDSRRRLMENATKTEMPLRDAKQQTSKDPKPPKHSTMIPNTEQGIQEQHLLEAVNTGTLPASLPCSSLASTSVSTVDTAAAVTAANISSAIAAAPSSSTLKRLRKQLQTKSPAEVATDDVNMWANKFLRDLDNLMASDKATNMTMMPTTTTTTTTTSSSTANSLLVASRNSISPGPTSPMLLSAAATAVIQSRYGKGAHDRYVVGPGSAAHDHHHQHQLSSGTGCGTTAATTSSTNGIVLRPEKHATIPLQSFNLDCRRLDNASAQASAASSGGNVTRTNVAYLRTLSAPTPSASQTIYNSLLHGNNDQLTSSSAGGKVISPKAQLGQRNSLAATGGGSYSLNASLDHHQNSNLTNFQSNDAAATSTDMSHGDIKSPMSSAAKLKPTTILKIEETSSKAVAGTVGAPSTLLQCSTPIAESAPTPTPTAADVESLHQKRLRQLNMEMDNLRNTSIDQSQQLSALMQQNQYCNGGGGGVGAGGQSSSNGNKHKTLMTTSSCAMPKKASTSNGTAATNATSSSMGSAATTMTCNRQQQQTPANVAATSYLLHGSDATKKGSTSTIWTSEESILRSVGAVDEDNNSTSSSACEEASGALSSGKSGISLDSSGVENDNNESGIGTATPPKDMSYWKSMPHHHHGHHHHHHHHHNQQDNESVSSLEAMRKIQFQKGSSVTSSDDPDLLEVLSLCDETHNDGEEDGEGRANHNLSSLKPQNNEEEEEDMDDDYDMVDEEDEGHDEFEIATYCDCDCTEDGDASSASAGSSGNRTNSSSINNGSLSDSNGSGGVVLRRKYAASPIMVPQKCRSHSLDTSSLPNSYHQQQHQGQGLHGIAANGHHHMHVGQHAQLARKLQHLRDRQKDRNQLSLALRQEPFQSLLAPTHFHELPSPSSASLHSGHEILDTQELSTKSNSAPLLLKQEKRLDDFANQNVTLRYSRSQSDRYLAEIEAVEACKWLRAAGFPQYAQMYEDHQFPIDLTNVAKDHTNLENDQLQSLYRRLCILNRCANMRVDQSHKPQTPQKEDSDDENFALSENWTFQPHIRRWSRIGEMGLEIPPAAKLTACEKTESSSKESSPDRFEDDSYDVLGAPLSLALPGAHADDSADPAQNDSTDLNASPLRRTGSERLKDGAKAILRRVESIKSRRRKRQGIVLSGPQVLDLSQLGQRSSMRKPDAVYSTPPSPSAVSPMHSFNKGPLFGNELKVPSQSDNFLSPNRASPKRTPTTPRSMRTSPLHFFTNTMPYVKEGKSDDSSSYYSDSQESSSAVNKLTIRKTPSKARRFLQRTGKVDDIGAHSDSECHQGRKLLIKDANSNTTEVKTKKLSRGGSLNLGRDGKKRDGFRSASFRSRSTTRKEIKPEDIEIIKKAAPVVRWHSFQMEERPSNLIFRKCFSQKNDPHSNEHGILFAAMSAGQLQMIRKLALVTLTGYMERYCPTHRSGWNWELPKFIKKIKMPDYKDKKVFGVPLLLILQRSGQTLPIAVRAAFRWLQLNALDQIGLFRKSGVKSRILKLKELIEYSETNAECMDVFDTQQAYDVADMLKQYFRDLPESLLTTKMSETFAAIFQHLPPEVRLDAVQSAVLLLPDENREILFALLEFLTLVAANSQYNQMTANNLAVCLAPSLFHSSISTGSNSVTASPRRKGKGSGVPDAKELFEAKASHECLAFMIQHYKQIYTAPKEKLSKCKFSYMEESKPLPLENLGEGMQFHNWRGYLYESTSATIKEGREKSRGWITTTSITDPNVEIAYKKVGDGHPLRLWRCITEIEGPPKDVLDYIIRQRASWDPNLLQSQTIKKFDENTEIFQYAIDGQQCTDFCVLRAWRDDLPRGACVIVETSIDHAKAKPMFNAVRGVVLASRYLIEPCGSGRSRVMHLARVDVKGKTPEWYNKSYGHISSHFLTRIRLAFKNVADGPESKV